MMPTIQWFESFSEEKNTVNQIKESTNTINFFSGPVQSVDPDRLEQNSIFTVRTHSRFTPDHVEKANCIISRSTGYDHLLEQKDLISSVPVGSLNEYATEAVAEHNLATAMSLLKRLPESTRAVHDYARNNLTGYDLYDTTPGIVGVGNIGGQTAEYLLDLGLTVLGHDREPKSRFQASNRFNYVPMETLFSECDLVFLCLPLTDSTKYLIEDSHLDKLPEDSFLINSGRGEVIKNQVLLASLKHGPLSGLALDVLNREKSISKFLRSDGELSDIQNPEIKAGVNLIRRDDVLATPHNAFNSRGALEAKVKQTLDNIEMFEQEGNLRNPVDF